MEKHSLVWLIMVPAVEGSMAWKKNIRAMYIHQTTFDILASCPRKRQTEALFSPKKIVQKTQRMLRSLKDIGFAAFVWSV